MIDNQILMTPSSVQNMFECNATISSNSRSLKSTKVVSSSMFADFSAITYQYHQLNHFDSPPNQMYFFPFTSWWCKGHSMTHAVNFASNVSTLDETQAFSKPIISF